MHQMGSVLELTSENEHDKSRETGAQVAVVGEELTWC